MTRIGILAPMPSELRPVAKALDLRRDGVLGPHPLYRGARGADEIVATGTGIGPALAAESTARLLDAFALDRVIVSGIAGGIDGCSAVGELVVPADVIDAATGERFTASPPAGTAVNGTIRTGDGGDYDLTDAQRTQLRHDGVVALDMETAAVARICGERGIPWVAFRGISDMAGDAGVGGVVLTLVHPDGSPRVGAGLRFLLTHPRRIPRLVRLGKESAHAARIAARATASACGRT